MTFLWYNHQACPIFAGEWSTCLWLAPAVLFSHIDEKRRISLSRFSGKEIKISSPDCLGFTCATCCPWQLSLFRETQVAPPIEYDTNQTNKDVQICGRRPWDDELSASRRGRKFLLQLPYAWLSRQRLLPQLHRWLRSTDSVGGFFRSFLPQWPHCTGTLLWAHQYPCGRANMICVVPIRRAAICRAHLICSGDGDLWWGWWPFALEEEKGCLLRSQKLLAFLAFSLTAICSFVVVPFFSCSR